MDWQLKLITLFVYTCNHYHDFIWTFCERQSNNDDPEFSDVEVIVIYLWGIMRGHQKVKKIYTYSKDHLSEWFPKLPSYKNYVSRLNRLNGVFVPLLAQIQSDFTQPDEIEIVKLIDSMPIMMAKAQRSGSAKVARELANKGYNSTKKTYFYGVKLHILGIRQPGALPLPDYIGLTAASEADINVLKEIASELHDTPIYADKAYIDELLSKMLAEQGSPLNTPIKRKKGQKHLFLFQSALSTLVSQVRQPIESLFNWIQEKTGIQIASHVRSTQGLLVHVFGKMAAAMLMLLANF